jgi:hypothetical protein
MTKEELHALARPGIRLRIGEIERELLTYFKGWPEEFVSKTPPQLLTVPTKNGNGNGHWPAIEVTAPKSQEHWSPERRAKRKLWEARYRRKLKAKADAQRSVRKATADFGEAVKTRVLKKKRTVSAATRRKMSLNMKRRHASGEIARQIAAAKANA